MTTTKTAKSARTELTADPHPRMSPAVRSWMIAVQDRMPTSIRESVEWRDAAGGIRSCTAITREDEKARIGVILDWMWGVLSDPHVVAAVPAQAQGKWQRMVTTRTPDAAADAASSVDAAATRDAAAYAAYATRTANAAAAAYAVAEAVRAASAAGEAGAVWTRHNPARVLTALTR